MDKLQISKEKVLVIGDDTAFISQAQTWLQSSGYLMFMASNGPAGLRALFSSRPDILLLDINLPDMDGLEVCRRTRELSDVPIILVAPSRRHSDVLKGFELGADDFINKPIDFTELIARIRAVLRRYRPNKQEESPVILQYAEIEIDWRSHQVAVRGQPIKLSPIEYKLLACLVENRGWLVTHKELLRKVWGTEYTNDKNLVKLYIRYLRQKIEKDPGQPQLILTERGVGYRFATPVKEAVK